MDVLVCDFDPQTKPFICIYNTFKTLLLFFKRTPGTGKIYHKEKKLQPLPNASTAVKITLGHFFCGGCFCFLLSFSFNIGKKSVSFNLV